MMPRTPEVSRTPEVYRRTTPDAYYRRLNVGQTASREDIVRSFRRLALGVHPDAHPDDPSAPARFRELAEAYEVLSDPERRAAYDRRTTGIPVRIEVRHTGRSEAHTHDPVFFGIADPGSPDDLPFRVGPVRMESGGARWTAGAANWQFDLHEALCQAIARWWNR